MTSIYLSLFYALLGVNYCNNIQLGFVHPEDKITLLPNYFLGLNLANNEGENIERKNTQLTSPFTAEINSSVFLGDDCTKMISMTTKIAENEKEEFLVLLCLGNYLRITKIQKGTFLKRRVIYINLELSQKL